MEIHAAGIGIHPVAHTASLMLHPEILHLMAHPFQLLSQLEHIGLRAAVGVKEFVDHQDLHLVCSSLLYTDVEISLHIFFFSLFVPLLLAAFLPHGQWFSLGIDELTVFRNFQAPHHNGHPVQDVDGIIEGSIIGQVGEEDIKVHRHQRIGRYLGVPLLHPVDAECQLKEYPYPPAPEAHFQIQLQIDVVGSRRGQRIAGVFGGVGIDEIVCEKGGIGIDLNMGCSAPQIYKTGAGIAWILKPLKETAEAVSKVKKSLDLIEEKTQNHFRFSVKCRLGNENFTEQTFFNFTDMPV